MALQAGVKSFSRARSGPFSKWRLQKNLICTQDQESIWVSSSSPEILVERIRSQSNLEKIIRLSTNNKMDIYSWTGHY